VLAGARQVSRAAVSSVHQNNVAERACEFAPLRRTSTNFDRLLKVINSNPRLELLDHYAPYDLRAQAKTQAARKLPSRDSGLTTSQSAPRVATRKHATTCTTMKSPYSLQGSPSKAGAGKPDLRITGLKAVAWC
jgi:hypothetical protein